MMELPALGRPMQLGMLYDCRDDTLIPGFTLWDPEVLKNDRDVRSQQGTHFNVITSDSINNKSSALNIEASLKASFMGGLVEVSGSAEYINDKRTTSRQSRLTLQYKTTTRFEQLTMKHLGRHNVQHPYVFDQGIGTHVVTGILYGAQAFFVFDRYLKNDESDQHVHGHVNAIIKKIPSFSMKGEGDLKLTESEKEEADKLQCKFYGDFAPKSNPASYEEAVVIYTQLPSMLGDNGEFAVPLTVWLYPLSKLDSNAAKLFREISVNIIGQVQNILEGFDQWKMRCDDLVKNNVCTDFPKFTEKLDLFRKLLLEFKQGFQQKIARALPKIRGGEAVEHVLIDIISDCEKSPFHSRLVEHWLKCREKEMNIVKSFVKGLDSFRIIRSREDLDELLVDFSIEHVVAFSFSSLGLEDDYLKVLSRFIRTQTEESYTPQKEWFDTVATSKKMRTKAKHFKDFASVNSTLEETTFVIMGFDDGEESTPEGGSLFHYEHGVLTTKDFEPPGVPGKPEILKTYHDSSILKWTSPQTGLACIQSYLVKYRETSPTHDPEWREFRTDSKATLATIPELQPNITYEFSVAAICEMGHSQGGAVSKVATTLPSSPPHNVRKNQVSRASITVVWDKPEVLGEGVRVVRYRVSYVPTFDTDPDHVLLTETEGDVCLCTIEDLDPGTTYKVSVSALCGTAKDSAFSEPVEITSVSAVNERTKNFRELIAQCDTLKKGDRSKGEPSLYKLRLTKGRHGARSKYQTYNFSRRNEAKRHLVTMVVGATGAGKSTLINGMVNYIFNVDWNDNFRFKIIAEEGENKAGGQAQSQTQMITSYTINPTKWSHLDFRLTIIDTPGFGDTRGIARDKAIVDQIRDFFADSSLHHVDHIDVIGFVAQASQARLTHTQRYVFDSVLAIFGKDIEQNIMMLVTFADGQKPPVVDAIKAANIPCSNNMFKFNNSALFANKTDVDQPSGGKSSNDVVGKNVNDVEERNADCFDKMFWKMGVQSMRHFFFALSQIEPKSLSLTQEVLKERQRLEAAVEGLQPQIQMGCGKLDELQEEQRILEQHEAEIEANKEFVYDVEVQKSQKIDITGHYITNCSRCHFTCHYPCAIADDKEKAHCAAMTGDGTCGVCPGRCVWSVHFNQAYRFEYYTEKETRTYAELESRYNDATGKKLTVEQVVKKHQEEFVSVQECVYRLITDSHRSLKRLEEIALRPNPLSTLDYVDLLIEAEQLEAKSGWRSRVKALQDVRKEAEILSQIKQANYNPFQQYQQHFSRKGKKKKGVFASFCDFFSGPFRGGSGSHSSV
ncbi:uncharacterized protein [Diadema antillarum]|uniref:uncharacterized protein n=1 Tax=Diadema antillarum TaxID=105358 RepID=UPI003A87AA85